jgi:DNA-binding winged helix-turn-helix (wHTH) protein/tetratricopeptide (TPR) repeat protein
VLLQNGRRVKIQDQPLQILMRLLETPGELVPRETLWRELWPNKNAEDSDRSLRVAAAKLRQALGDSPIEPHLIETVPRRGYQFIGQVVALPGASLLPPSIAALPPTLESAPLTIAPVARPSAVPKRWNLLPAAVVLLAIVAAGFLYEMRFGRGAAGIDPSSLTVVGGVVNSTGEPQFDGVLSVALQSKLEESPYLNLASEDSFQRLAPIPEATPQSSVLKACADVHAGQVISGELTARHPGYRLTLSAWRCSDGGRVGRALSQEFSSQADMLPVLDAVSAQMRRQLGEPQSSLDRFNVPTSQAMTSSMGALAAFTQGDHKHFVGKDAESIGDYKLAVALDSDFALAYARLGSVYEDAGEDTDARQAYRRAFELRDRTTERARFYITSHYFSSTGEIPLALRSLQLWRQVYPRDPIAASNLSDLYNMLGDPQKGFEQAAAAVQLDPDMDYAYIDLAWSEARTGHYASLRQLCDKYTKASIGLRAACLMGDFAQGDTAAMHGELKAAQGDPAESQLLAGMAWALLHQGRAKEATRYFLAAAENARANHLDEFAAEIALDQAALEVDMDQSAPARKRALSVLDASPRSATVEAFAALVLARTGDTARAQALAAKAAAEKPSDTILNTAILPSVRAAEWMHAGDNGHALRELEQARPYDFCGAMELAPAYYRGLAFLRDRQWDHAAAEFTRVISQRVSFPTSPYVPLSQLLLGRALQLSGDTAGARAVYSDVAKSWAGADADFAPLQKLTTFEHELAPRNDSLRRQ